MAEVYAIFFGVGSLAIVLHAYCCAIVFMDKHAAKIAFPDPVTLPQQLHLRRAVQVLAGVPEDSIWDE